MTISYQNLWEGGVMRYFYPPPPHPDLAYMYTCWLCSEYVFNNNLYNIIDEIQIFAIYLSICLFIWLRIKLSSFVGEEYSNYWFIRYSLTKSKCTKQNSRNLERKVCEGKVLPIKALDTFVYLYILWNSSCMICLKLWTLSP